MSLQIKHSAGFYVRGSDNLNIVTPFIERCIVGAGQRFVVYDMNNFTHVVEGIENGGIVDGVEMLAGDLPDKLTIDVWKFTPLAENSKMRGQI